MQNAALRTATRCTQDTNIQHLHDDTLILPIHEHLQLHASQYKHKHNIHHTPYTNIQHNSIVQGKKKPLSLTTATTQQTNPQTPHSHYNRHKTNMRHIHTSIVSRHLATRGNNKILHTSPPHNSCSEEILLRLTRRTLAQLRTNKTPSLKTYLHKFDAKTHPSQLCPLCNTHIHNTHNLFNCTHIHTTLLPLDLWTYHAGVNALLARWTEKLAGGPQTGRSDFPPPH